MIMRMAQDDGKKDGEDDEMDRGDYGRVALAAPWTSMAIFEF